MDGAHRKPPSPLAFMLLQMRISVWGLLGEWDENVSFVFLSLWRSQGARGQKGSRLSFTLRNQLGTARELPMNGEEADWSARQLYGGHWCIPYGERHRAMPRLFCEVQYCRNNALWWPREHKQNITRRAACRNCPSLSWSDLMSSTGQEILCSCTKPKDWQFSQSIFFWKASNLDLKISDYKGPGTTPR